MATPVLVEDGNTVLRLTLLSADGGGRRLHLAGYTPTLRYRIDPPGTVGDGALQEIPMTVVNEAQGIVEAKFTPGLLTPGRLFCEVFIEHVNGDQFTSSRVLEYPVRPKLSGSLS